MFDLAMHAKRFIEAAVSPLGIMTLLLAFGIILSMGKRFARAGRRFLMSGALLFILFLFSPLAQYLIYGLECRFQPLLVPPQAPPVSRIVVLAGYAEEHPGLPITSNVSLQTIGNMSEGLRLYRLIPGSKLIMSGGVARRGEKPVAAMMADFLQQMGVPAADLIVEGASQTTYENFLETRKLVGTQPFILVAAACDLRRAAAVAKKLGMNSIPAPACICTLQHPRKFGLPSLENLSRIQWAFHEYLGYAWYRVLGRV
jgi:uncharacterized SAM-binding protein YcdF (DUF218 family)